MKIPKIKIPKVKLPSKQQVKAAMPTVLAVTSVVGNTVAACLYIDRTIKATRVMDDMHEEGCDKKEIAKKVVPQYILPTVIFVGAQICTIECNVLNKKQRIALASALVGADYRYKRFKDKVQEEKGPEYVKAIERDIAVEDFHDYCEIVGNQMDGTSKYIAPEGTVLFYDAYRNTGKEDGYFSSTMIQVKQAMYHLNRNFCMRGDAYLNEFYEFIGIPTTNYGEYAYWDMYDELTWIDIEIREMPVGPDLVAYAIDYIYAPQVSKDVIEKGLV